MCCQSCFFQNALSISFFPEYTANHVFPRMCYQS
jgi:hypothetical protein